MNLRIKIDITVLLSPYYLAPIDESALPKKIFHRFSMKIEDVVPLQNCCLLVFFRDGTVRKCDLTEYFEKTQRLSILGKHPEYFRNVQIQTGGYGVQWDENLSIPDSVLYKMGKRAPLTADDFKAFCI